MSKLKWGQESKAIFDGSKKSARRAELVWKLLTSQSLQHQYSDSDFGVKMSLQKVEYNLFIYTNMTRHNKSIILSSLWSAAYFALKISKNGYFRKLSTKNSVLSISYRL